MSTMRVARGPTDEGRRSARQKDRSPVTDRQTAQADVVAGVQLEAFGASVSVRLPGLTLMLVMHVILMDILISHGGWLCVEKEVPQMPALDACLTRSRGPSGEPVLRLGVPLLDDYLEFLAGRCRPNTVLAAAYDLRVFLTVVAKAPDEVCAADVLGFITAQRTGRVGEYS